MKTTFNRRRIRKAVTRKPLPVPIPSDLAEALQVDASFISKVNNAKTPVPLDFAIDVMKLAVTDERLTGLSLLDMKPELKPAMPFLCGVVRRRKSPQ